MMGIGAARRKTETAPPKVAMSKGKTPAPTAGKRRLTPAAKRALAEAEARRETAGKRDTAREVGGRKGPEPTRYGDWEKDGIVSDF